MEIQPIQIPISLTQGLIQPIATLSLDVTRNSAEVSPSNFKDLLKKALNDLNASEVGANDSIKSLATGGEDTSMM